jgi:hypothetical protein
MTTIDLRLTRFRAATNDILRNPAGAEARNANIFTNFRGLARSMKIDSQITHIELIVRLGMALDCAPPSGTLLSFNKKIIQMAIPWTREVAEELELRFADEGKLLSAVVGVACVFKLFAGCDQQIDADHLPNEVLEAAAVCVVENSLQPGGDTVLAW